MKAGEVRSYSEGLGAFAETRSEKQVQVLRGYAIVFESESQDLGGFTETIARGSANRLAEPGYDIRAIRAHNRDLVMGRTKSGTMSLSIDGKGVAIENVLPDSQAGRDLFESVKRQDIDGMSFYLLTRRDKWYTKDGKLKRAVLDFDTPEFTYTAFPAYQATAVGVRSLLVENKIEQASEVNSMLLRLKHGLEPGDKDRELATEYRSILEAVLPGEYRSVFAEFTKGDYKPIPLSVARAQLELLGIDSD